MSKVDPHKVVPQTNDWVMYADNHPENGDDKTAFLIALFRDTLEHFRLRSLEDATFYGHVQDFLTLSEPPTISAPNKKQVGAAMKKQSKKTKK